MIDFTKGFVPGAVSWVNHRRPLWRQIVCAAAIAVFALLCQAGCVPMWAGVKTVKKNADDSHARKQAQQEADEAALEKRFAQMPTAELLRWYEKTAGDLAGAPAVRMRYYAVIRAVEARFSDPGMLGAIEHCALRSGKPVAAKDAVRLLQRYYRSEKRDGVKETMIRIYTSARCDDARAEALAVLEEESIKAADVFFAQSAVRKNGVLKEAQDRYTAFLNRT